MIQLTIGSTSIQNYLTDYNINVEPITSDNTFTAYDGTRVENLLGHSTVISCTLKKVPHSTAESIAKEVQAESFSVTYTTPISITDTFKCTKYSAKPRNADPRSAGYTNATWDISLTLESVGSGSSAGGL